VVNKDPTAECERTARLVTASLSSALSGCLPPTTGFLNGSSGHVRTGCETTTRQRHRMTLPPSPRLIHHRAQHDALPELERPWLASRIQLMETTDMAVVVSQGQNEIAHLDRLGLDIRLHRERMNREDLAEKFKSAEDPLRLVFVCAMWMTGFDAPSVSTIYLDRPMRNHTLMQTIARAHRVFPNKDNGLIVDYVGVFRNLEKALAIYGAANAEAGVDTPIQDIDALVRELEAAIDIVVGLCTDRDVDLIALPDANGFAHVALRDSAVEALLEQEETRTTLLAATRP
jgi:type I restriction enzyme, R subunit